MKSGFRQQQKTKKRMMLQKILHENHSLGEGGVTFCSENRDVLWIKVRIYFTFYFLTPSAVLGSIRQTQLTGVGILYIGIQQRTKGISKRHLGSICTSLLAAPSPLRFLRILHGSRSKERRLERLSNIALYHVIPAFFTSQHPSLLLWPM